MHCKSARSSSNGKSNFWTKFQSLNWFTQIANLCHWLFFCQNSWMEVLDTCDNYANWQNVMTSQWDNTRLTWSNTHYKEIFGKTAQGSLWGRGAYKSWWIGLKSSFCLTWGRVNIQQRCLLATAKPTDCLLESLSAAKTTSPWRKPHSKRKCFQ